MRDHVLTGNSRVFLIEDRAGPANPPSYEDNAMAGAVSWPQGDVTIIRKPAPGRYNQFVSIGKFSGEPGVPELPLTLRYTDLLSKMLRIARKGCDSDVQVHFGACEDPRDFDRGWAKIAILEAARPTTYGTSDLGTLEPEGRAPINEEVPMQGEDYYEVVPITFAEKAASLVTREILDIHVCDTEACGECGTTSDGCQKIFALSGEVDASPGLPPAVLYSSDGGDTWASSTVSALSPAEEADAIDCVGNNLVVISQDAVSLVYADITDLLAGTPTWAEVTTGFSASGAPRRIASVSAVHTWIVGAGGYIYFTADPTSGVSVQDAGVATTQVLNAIHAIDEFTAVAVGVSNAIVYTNNGGDTWQAITGPAVGVTLNTVWMKSALEWFVGTATGLLYYTRDGGATWTAKGFPGSGTGVVRDIRFYSNSVGYMAHDAATPRGRILRSVNGGYTWYVLPEESGFTLPLNDRINKIAVCADANTIFGAGLGDNATDGIIVKGAGE